jgi:hypothetical protein
MLDPRRLPRLLALTNKMKSGAFIVADQNKAALIATTVAIGVSLTIVGVRPVAGGWGSCHQARAGGPR